MTFRLKRSETVAEGVRRISIEQLDRVLADIECSDLPSHDVVHSVRKRFKKLRSLLRLIQPGAKSKTRELRHWLRDAGRSLSTVRDRQSREEAFERLRLRLAGSADEFLVIDAHRQLQCESSQEMEEDPRELLQALKQELTQQRDAFSLLDLPEDEKAADLIFEGMADCYRKGRCSLKKATDVPSDEHFHELRKRVKDHWYQLRLLRNIWPTMMRARIGSAGRLSDLLGEDHDLSLLSAQKLIASEMADESPRPALNKLMERQRQHLQSKSLHIAARLFAEKPKALRRRLRRYWDLWRG